MTTTKVRTSTKVTPTPREGLTPKQVADQLKVPARKVRIFARKLFKDAHDLGQSWAFTPAQVDQLRKAITPPS